MLFKILHGDKSRISTNITPYHEGYCYVTHDGDFYVDMNNERVKLNAKDAETIMGASLATILSNTNLEIPTSGAVHSAIEEATEVYVGANVPTDTNIKVWIDTSKDGVGTVPVLPRVAMITLGASSWTGSTSPYSQVVEIPTVTVDTKVELNATVTQIVNLHNEGIALMVENDAGVVTVYSFGGKPSSNMVMQVTLQEVSYV
jgi:hypothetical protein